MARGALLVLLLAAPALSSMYPDLSEFKKGLKMNAQRCANAHHVQYLQVMAMMEAPMRTGYDRNSKCFICCLMEKYEMLTPDGEFMDGTMRRYALDLPESQFKTVVNKYLDLCLREDNDDICEKCYQFAKCYYDRSKVKPDGSRKQYYQRQHLNNYYEGSSGRLFQSVGNWASNQWNHATNGPKGLR